jgi:hypothetical protein
MKIIDILHIKLTRKYAWYAKWHTKHRSNLIHWMIFLASCIAFAAIGTASLAGSQPLTTTPSFYFPPTQTPTPSPVPVVKTKEEITTYVVKEGDSLWSIAEQKLGSGFLYKDIIELNKDRYPSLKTSPDELIVGWELIIKKTTVPYTVLEPAPSTGGEITSPQVVTGGGITKPLGFFDVFNVFALVLLGLIVVGLVIRYLVWRF